ncbi:MAG TPA: helix-turn-helix domain-containing protein [Miltoncostaeaceae bacterium]|nr:helix-turn-helix domain-containing protein [Miltoncostaeaceae bacterium]
MDTDPGRLLTTDEAAALLRVSASTIRREVARGALPAARIGRKGLLRIRQADVLALREGGRGA